MKRVVYSEPNWTTAQQDALRDLVQKIDLCGCGSATHWEIVVLVLSRKRTEDRVSLYDGCEDASGRWVEFAAKVLDRAGLLEHGGGIGGAWLSDAGRELLRFLDEFGTDDDKWPPWATCEEWTA